MNDLDRYLARHFLTEEKFAATCAIAVAELAALVDEGLVPQPSYRVIGGSRLVSAAFGELEVRGAASGRYFPPGNASWVALALDVRRRSRPPAARDALATRFKANFVSALVDLDKTVFRLPDSFTDSGELRRERLDARAAAAWDAFLKGIFGLCVADPSSEKSIARKEILQEALTTLTDGGARSDFSADERAHILQLIDDYAQAAMPFSPPEYPRCSRKRLVDDLRLKLAAS